MNLLLLSTNIITTDGTYRRTAITSERAREIAGAADGIESAIGHESTATLLAAILGVPVAVNRAEIAQAAGQRAIVCKPNGRAAAPDMTTDAMERVGYGLYLLERLD